MDNEALECHRQEHEGFEDFVERFLKHINWRLNKLEDILSAQEQVDAALQGDKEAIEKLGQRVVALQTALETSIKGLEEHIKTLEGEGVNVTGLVEHLTAMKTELDAIDPPAPEPPAGG